MSPATTFTDEQIMLTLAGLTYRGFEDNLSGEPHAAAVSRKILDALRTLSPVRDGWDLVWGPVTERGPRAVFDSSAMYIARDRTAPHRYTVAIRGTNPIAVEDWLIGDLWVRSSVAWPYATSADAVAISASTAVGLATLQQMRSVSVTSPAPPTAARENPDATLADRIRQIDRHWMRLVGPILQTLAERFGAGASIPPVPSLTLRRALPTDLDRGGPLDLLSFLRLEAETAVRPIEVAVTGHSKGGALAPAVALWLKEALNSGDSTECWDPTRSARVSCHAFAGQTPGNAGFAARLAAVLGPDYHHLRNMNDVVTHAWQDDELRQIGGLYGVRSELFRPLLGRIVDGVQPLGYRQTEAGVRKFSGGLDSRRPFGLEFVHQHMQAYLDELKLGESGVQATSFFV